MMRKAPHSGIGLLLNQIRRWLSEHVNGWIRMTTTTELVHNSHPDSHHMIFPSYERILLSRRCEGALYQKAESADVWEIVGMFSKGRLNE